MAECPSHLFLSSLCGVDFLNFPENLHLLCKDMPDPAIPVQSGAIGCTSNGTLPVSPYIASALFSYRDNVLKRTKSLNPSGFLISSPIIARDSRFVRLER